MFSELSLTRAQSSCLTGGVAAIPMIVGSVPSGADLLTFETSDNATILTATASSGTYFVKMQSLNACGASGVSNEVAVTIP